MALRSVQRLERRDGFRPRCFDSQSRRESLEYQAIARIQGTEGEAQEPQEAHERMERLLRRAVHGAGEGPE
jgi:hypothetical protein